MIETKIVGGHVTETKEISADGIRVGVAKGYIATWQPDKGGRYGVPEQFFRGAFAASLEAKRIAGDRPLKLKWMHSDVIGKFPLATVREDDIGLWGEGHINLEMAQGRDAYALVKQGAVSDFSIGFKAIADNIVNDRLREIHEAEVFEGSFVDEPMNPGAVIVEVKGAIGFQDLPIASADSVWSASAAQDRLKTLTGSEDEPSDGFRRAFLFQDTSAGNSYGAFKLPIADVVNGKLMAIPKAIFAAAAALKGDSLELNDATRNRVTAHVERYYKKMGKPSPFSQTQKRFFGVEDVKLWTPRDFRDALGTSEMFSKDAVKILGSRLQHSPIDDKGKIRDNPFNKLLEDMRS